MNCTSNLSVLNSKRALKTNETRFARAAHNTGEIIANVESRHRSVEFIWLLRRLDEHK